MLRLIIKDLTFNKLQALFGILLAALVSLMILAGRQYMIVPFVMGPSLLFNQVVGKGCYSDDKNGAYIFLRSLPLPGNTIVFSKYAESILVLVVSYAVIFGSNPALMFFGQPLYQLNASLLMVVSALLIYSAVYLGLYFKYDFAAAQQSSFVLIAVWIGIFKLQDYLNSSGTALTRMVHVNFFYFLLLAAIVIFIASGKLAINVFAVKE